MDRGRFSKNHHRRSGGEYRMTEMEFINLTVGILKEFLEDVPDEYSITVEDFPTHTIPVMNFDTNDEFKEFVLKPGDLMKNKRYIQIDDGLDFTIKDTETNELLSDSSLEKRMNELNEENQSLKLRGLTEDKYHQRYNHLIQLINNKINDYENRLDDSDIDDNLPYYMNIKGRIEALIELRDEVKQWELKQ